MMENNKPVLKALKNFNTYPHKYIDTFNIKMLAEMIKLANHHYYNTEHPLLSDTNYDILQDRLVLLSPNHPILNQIGSAVSEEMIKNKVELPYWMGSMNKVKPGSKALSSWLNKYNQPFVLSDKLDGVSCLYYRDITGEKLYTRGNGSWGQDISYLIPYFNIPNIEHLIPETFCARGELILSKTNFIKYSNANARNLVSGLVNSKKFNKQLAKEVDIIMYEVIEPSESISSEQFERLTQLGFNVVPYKIIKECSQTILEDYLIERKHASDYDIDGIIVTENKSHLKNQSGNPKHSVAFKMQLDEQKALTKVIEVIWTPSKDGYLKPRVKVEPIVLGGTKISFATGFNAKYIVENNIGEGAIIEIVRSGDVIPYINNIISVANKINKMKALPECDYYWNDTGVDILLKNPEENNIVLVKKLLRFFKKLSIKGLSGGNIKRLITSGLDSVKKILGAHIEDFKKVDGFKIKMATNIYNNIHQIIDKPIKLEILMEASNKFGRGFARSKLKLIVNKFPDILSQKYTFEDLCQIDGFSTITSQQFINNLPTFIQFYNTISKFVTIQNISSQDEKILTNSTFKNKKVVFTGFRDSELSEFITKNGGKVINIVNKNTYMVIKKNNNKPSSKIKKALELGIPIYSREDFIQTFIE